MSREEKTEYLLSEIKKKTEEYGGIIKTSQITELGVDYRRILAWVKSSSRASYIPTTFSDTLG